MATSRDQFARAWLVESVPEIPLGAATDAGEPGGTRTHDPMIKSHVLYQLSYGLASGAA